MPTPTKTKPAAEPDLKVRPTIDEPDSVLVALTDRYDALMLTLDEAAALTELLIEQLESESEQRDNNEERPLYALHLVARAIRDKEKRVYDQAETLVQLAMRELRSARGDA